MDVNGTDKIYVYFIEVMCVWLVLLWHLLGAIQVFPLTKLFTYHFYFTLPLSEQRKLPANEINFENKFN